MNLYFEVFSEVSPGNDLNANVTIDILLLFCFLLRFYVFIERENERDHKWGAQEGEGQEESPHSTGSLTRGWIPGPEIMT